MVKIIDRTAKSGKFELKVSSFGMKNLCWESVPFMTCLLNSTSSNTLIVFSWRAAINFSAFPFSSLHIFIWKQKKMIFLLFRKFRFTLKFKVWCRFDPWRVFGRFPEKVQEFFKLGKVSWRSGHIRIGFSYFWLGVH